MIFIALLLLLLAASACLGFNRILPTRALGILSASVSLLAALAIFAGHLWGPPFEVPPLTWATMEQFTVTLNPQLDGVGVVLACTLLGAGALLLLALALALAPTISGFGGLFAWSLLALAAALLGLGSTGLLLPFTWASAVILSYAAVRSSGALNRIEHIPHGLTFGLSGSLLLMVGLLLNTLALEADTLPGLLPAACVVVASLLLMGAAPFQAALDETALSPAALFGLFAGLVLPLLSLGTLLQWMSDIRLLMPASDLPASWRSLLLVLGSLSMLAGAAGALREHSLRRLLAWLVSAQAGMVLLAVGMEGPLAALAAPALLVNLSLTTVCGALAVAVFERQIGSDDYTLMQTGIDLRLPGMLWVCAAASAWGMPALWGFWGRRWLFAAAIEQAPWVVPLMLATSVLLVLAYLGPLARFWSSSNTSTPLAFAALRSANRPFLPVLLLTPLLLLVPGLIPQPALEIYQSDVLPQAVQGVNPMQPLLFEPVVHISEQVAGFVAALGGVLFGLLLQLKPARHIPSDEDMTPVVLPPAALAGQLTPLAAAGYPAHLMRGLWATLLQLGRWARIWMALFEQRFYLAGVLLALISLILLMAQG